MADTSRFGRAALSRSRLAVTAAVALLSMLVPILQPRADAQLPPESDNRYAGLEWRFVRIRYHFQAEAAQDYGEPWYIDAPAAEQNLSRRVKTATAIHVEDPIVKDHQIFSCFYKIDGFPQVAGLGSFLAGRTWEKGGMMPHLRAILDDTGRPMVLINWNTDMGDGWEWSNAEEYPGYIKYTAMAYRMEINEIVYALTH
jgi:hypothetical protein